MIKHCGCGCHTGANIRHFMPCCNEPPKVSAPPPPPARSRTIIIPAISEDQFIAIFREEGVDKEWAEIVYGRWAKSGELMTEQKVRQAAKDWAEDDGF